MRVELKRVRGRHVSGCGGARSSLPATLEWHPRRRRADVRDHVDVMVGVEAGLGDDAGDLGADGLACALEGRLELDHQVGVRLDGGFGALVRVADDVARDVNLGGQQLDELVELQR